MVLAWKAVQVLVFALVASKVILLVCDYMQRTRKRRWVGGIILRVFWVTIICITGWMTIVLAGGGYNFYSAVAGLGCIWSVYTLNRL